MKKFKLKLWQRSLVAFGLTTLVFGSSGILLYVLKNEGNNFNYFSSKSLANNLHELKDVSKYKIFFQDPITKKKIGNYDYKNDTLNGITSSQWFFNYQKKHKRSPVLIVRAGPVEFKNNYLEAISAQTFISLVEWFSKEVPWGAGISSLSNFNILRGLVQNPGAGSVTLGSYADEKLIKKRIKFYPDAFFKEIPVSKFLMRLLNEDIDKEQIPALIASINHINNQLKIKHSEENWKNYAVRLYSLEKVGNKYRPFVAKGADIIYTIDKNSPLQKEKISDVDVILNEDDITVKTINQDSYKIKYSKNIAKIQVWKSFFADKWQGFSFEFMKYLIHHEYGHLQTMGFVKSSVNNYVGSQVPGVAPNTIRNPYDFDELNRYLKARTPKIRALRVSYNFHKGKNGWDWDYYQDRLKDWKKGILKIKPDPRDFDQIAFEYQPDGSENWVRETAEKVFGSSVDPTDPSKAPYQVDPDEFMKKINAGERPRFFMYSLKDARLFAKVTKIPLSALYIMNAFDSLPATKNPSLSNDPLNYFEILKPEERAILIEIKETISKRSIATIIKYYTDLVKTNYVNSIKEARSQAWNFINLRNTIIKLENLTYGLKYLDNDNKFNSLGNVFLGIKAWNGVKLLLEVELLPEEEIVVSSDTPTLELLGKEYIINPLAKDKEGNFLSDKPQAVFDLLKEIASLVRSQYNRGAEFILNRAIGVGNADEEFTFDLSEHLSGKKFSISSDNFFYLNSALPSEKYKSIFTYEKKILNLSFFFPGDDIKKHSSFNSYTKQNEVIEAQIIDKDGKIYKVNPEHIKISPFYHPEAEKRGISIKIDKMAFKDIKDPKIHKFVVKVKIKGFVKPSDKLGDHPDSDRQLRKWLKSVSNGGWSNLVNPAFSHYKFNFPEVLTRDWVALTKSVQKPSTFKYNSKLFPIQHKDFGINVFFNPSVILDFKINGVPYRDLILYEDYKNPKQDQQHIEYKKDFIRLWFDYLSSHKNKFYKSLTTKFVPRTNLNYDDLEKYSDSLSFLNIQEIVKDGKRNSFDNYDDPENSNLKKYTNYLLKTKFFSSFDIKKGWTELFMDNSDGGYYGDRWLRANMTVDNKDEGTKDSWVFYDNDGKPVPYQGDMKKINGDPIKTRPEAYWTFFLKLRGVGLRNIAAMWFQPERDAVAIWGYIPANYKNRIKYLQFKNVKTGEIIRKKIWFDVDNLFYYPNSPGGGDKIRLRDEGFTSWNIDYLSIKGQTNDELKNGQYQVNFVDANGKIVDIEWNGRKIKMTGNSESEQKNKQHIVSLNWFDKKFAPAYIEQNENGQDILHIKNVFPN